MENNEERKPFDIYAESKAYAVENIRLSQRIHLTLSAIILLLSLNSCTKTDINEFVTEGSSRFHEVSVSLRGIDFNLLPVTRATADDAGITHIALKVFDTAGNVVADTCQIAA